MPVCCAGNGKVSRNRVHSTGWIYSRLNLMHLSLSTRVKAADAAADLLPGFVSVTSPNGAQSPDKADWLALKGRTVFIWPDADQPGEVYAREVARLAYAAGARRVSIMNLALLAQQRTPPGDELPQGYDAADCLAEGVEPERLRAMLATAEAWLEVEVQPDEPPTSRHRINDNGKPDGPVARFELSFEGKGRRPGVYWIGTVDKWGKSLNWNRHGFARR